MEVRRMSKDNYDNCNYDGNEYSVLFGLFNYSYDIHKLVMMLHIRLPQCIDMQNFEIEKKNSKNPLIDL